MTDEDGQIIVGIDTSDSAGRPSSKFIPLNGEEFRRSVYVQMRRSKPLGMLETFDLPRMEPNCERRNASTIAPQSLAMMNGEFTLAQSKFFAERVVREVGTEPAGQVQHAWLLAFGSTPSANELKNSVDFLAKETAYFQKNPTKAGACGQGQGGGAHRADPCRRSTPFARRCSRPTNSSTSTNSRMKPHPPACLSRRHFLATSGFHLSAFGLAYLLQQDGLLGAPEKPVLETPHYDLLPKKPPFTPKAKAMISMFMQGGPSQIDLFDPKPELDKLDGQKFPGDVKYDDAAHASTTVMASAWKYQKHGQCGTEVSELLPGFASIVDDVVLLRGMQSSVNNHGQAIYALQNGRSLGGRPTIGSWLTYALGSESQEFARLRRAHRSARPAGARRGELDQWLAALDLSRHRGAVPEPRIPNLDAAPYLRGEAQENYLGFLNQLNHEHLDRHPGETDLEARIASYRPRREAPDGGEGSARYFRRE